MSFARIQMVRRIASKVAYKNDISIHIIPYSMFTHLKVVSSLDSQEHWIDKNDPDKWQIEWNYYYYYHYYYYWLLITDHWSLVIIY